LAGLLIDSDLCYDAQQLKLEAELVGAWREACFFLLLFIQILPIQIILPLGLAPREEFRSRFAGPINKAGRAARLSLF